MIHSIDNFGGYICSFLSARLSVCLLGLKEWSKQQKRCQLTPCVQLNFMHYEYCFGIHKVSWDDCRALLIFHTKERNWVIKQLISIVILRWCYCTPTIITLLNTRPAVAVWAYLTAPLVGYDNQPTLRKKVI